MTKKILAIILSVVMALSVCTVAFAAGAGDDSDQFVIDTLLDNTNYTSWEYVDINMKALNDQMAVYTAFALYDSAWKNYATKEVNISNAKAILLGLIEKAEYSFDDGYVDEIISVLETAEDVNDFIQKVNQYANIELFASEGWGTAFDVINGVIKVGNAYQEYRDKFVKAYAEALSVQMANAYYIDMLEYVADNTEYEVLATAAEQLIDDMNASVESVLQEIAAEAAGDGANMAFEYLAKLALNTNVYTATALKIYQIGTSIADVLWNTGDLYSLIDTLKTTYYFQSDLADYTAAALAGDDADKAAISVDMLLTTRATSEQALFDMKLAENKGIITAIQNKLYKTVYNDTEIMLAAIDAMRDVIENENDKVVSALYIYGPAAVSAAGVAASKSVVSDYSGETLQVYFLTSTDAVTLTGTADGKVTAIMDVTGAEGIEDWSFTDVIVNAGTAITFNPAAAAAPVYFVNGEEKSFNDELAAEGEKPDVTVSDVVDATTEVVKETVKQSSFAKWISDFFAKIAAFFTNLFKK